MVSRTAVVVGGLGVIGRNLVDHLERLPDWEIVALSRRRPDFATRARFIVVDLLDRDQTLAELKGLDGDVELLSYLLNASRREHALADLARERLHLELPVPYDAAAARR